MKPKLHLLVVLVVATASTASAEGIINTKHNLSAAGPGNIKAARETEVCVFCHTPHGGSGDTPLWNHHNSVATYTPYNSSTIKASVGQPTGASKLCLSCHDGTVALGMVHSRSTPIEMQGGVTTLPSGTTRLGTDLSDDHPVSFTYDSTLAAQDGQLKDPATLDKRVRVDHEGQLQCTACHNPHDNQFGKFLVMENTASALCVQCHSLNGWQNSTHRTSTATWNGTGENPWPHTTHTTVADNACESCHAPHTAGTPQRLLNFANEEKNCFTCHSGTVAAKNVAADFNKLSVHPIELTSGVHDPMEDPVNPTRHVECADCHNPHAANATTAVAPNASGAIAGVMGMDASGSAVNNVTKEYELCFRCHADSVQRGESRVARQFPETNTRIEFRSASASYHPVEAIGKNPNVPSLIAPYTTSSLIRCTDCHNSDQGPGAGGTGANGPHGSAFEPILERQLALTDNNTETAGTYALCYKCHSRASILADESFKFHRLHVVDKQTACTTCHDSHGVATTSKLINFNTSPGYVTPGSNGRLEFISTGTYSGNCSLTCHGKDHDATAYPLSSPAAAKLLRRR